MLLRRAEGIVVEQPLYLVDVAQHRRDAGMRLIALQQVDDLFQLCLYVNPSNQ